MKQSTFHQVETLEQRRVLTLDFVSAYVAEESPFYVTNVTTDAELSESIQQLTLSFTPGSEIDGSDHSLAGVKVMRTGGAGDDFLPVGSQPDVPVEIGSLVVDDSPNANQIIIRFANTLVDDDYKVVIESNTETKTNEYTGLTEQTVSGLRSFVDAGIFSSIEQSVTTGITKVAAEANDQNQIAVDSTSGITAGMLVFRGSKFEGVVEVVDTATTFRISEPVTFDADSTLRFETNQIQLSSSAGITPGMLAVGDGIPDGTTVLANDSSTKVVTLSTYVESDIAVATTLHFFEPQLFRDGDSGSFEFRLSLGQQINAVVPQPVVRGADTEDAFGLKQRKNIIDVFFDRNEALDKGSAEDINKYTLIRVNPATGADASVTATADAATAVSSIVLDDTTDIIAGMLVAGTGIPAGTTVLSNDSPTGVTLSAPVTLDQDAVIEFRYVGISPTSVDYVAEDEEGTPVHRARLTFNPALGEDGHDATLPSIEDGNLYRLEIGGPGVVVPVTEEVEQVTAHDTFDTAQDLGTVGENGIRVSASIGSGVEADTIAQPGTLPDLRYPTPVGTSDEPGHRHIPVDDTTSGLPGISTGAPAADSEFNISLVFNDNFPEAFRGVVRDAAARWERVIVGDVSNQGLIDDIEITVSAPSIDGQGGVLGSASTGFRRGPLDTNPELPFTASIRSDIDDMDIATLYPVMVHEMGHALGFVDTSRALGLIRSGWEATDNDNPPVEDTEHIFTDAWIGPNAVEEFRKLDPTADSVPLQVDGGRGTHRAHWEELRLGNEIMTGNFNGGQVNPLSRLTVAAFEDLGYEVDYAAADPYRNLLPDQDALDTEIHNVAFNFQTQYGFDPQGNPLTNVINGEQQLRVREIFDLFSQYAGIRFIETPDSGITIATGDIRAISDNTPPTSVNGLARGGIVDGEVSADALAVVNSIRDWGESEYGGDFFLEAIRQIGRVLGLWQSYDLPSVLGESLPGEGVFPSDYDILHLQQLYPRAGTEIDVYSFNVATDGQLTAETIAERLDATSTLDTVISVYDSTGNLLSRNDDSFGRDSRVETRLEAGDYSVAVSSTGNTDFNLNVAHSGGGGRTQGAYELRLTHEAAATDVTSIQDKSGTFLDGDRDGTPGGIFNFHFETAAAAETLFVDKIATDSLVPSSVTAGSVTKTFKAAASPTNIIELNDDQAVVTTVQKIFQEQLVASNEITLTAAGNTNGIEPGMSVTGAGIPGGTTVVSFNASLQTITLSAPVTFSDNEELDFSAELIKKGMMVEGTGIAGGITVSSFDASLKTVTLSAPVTLSVNQEVTFKTIQVELDYAQGLQNGPIAVGMVVIPVDPASGDSVPEGTEVLSVEKESINALVDVDATFEEASTVASASIVTATLTDGATFVTATADAATAVPSIVLDDTTGIADGMRVDGTGIPVGTTVLTNDSATGITLSAPVTLAQDTELRFWTSIDLSDTTDITAGMLVAGTGIPAGTTVLSNDSATAITLSAPVTLAQGTALEFWTSIDLDDATDITAGMLVAGTGIPADTTVLDVDLGANTIELSNPTTLLLNTALKFWEPVTLVDTTGIQEGMWVSGTGVSPGTKVISVDSSKDVTLSKPLAIATTENLEFWFDEKVTLTHPVEISQNTALRFVTPGNGSVEDPFLTVGEALSAADTNTSIIRVIGNEGKELNRKPFPRNYAPDSNPYDYYLGTDSQGRSHSDGSNFVVPSGVTLMVDAGATFRLENTNLEVGSSSELVSRSGAALQTFGTPDANVELTSVFFDPAEDTSGAAPRQNPRGGDWGGIVLRADSDWQPASEDQLAHYTLRPVLNNIANTVISFGGGQVVVDAELQKFSALQIEDTRPIVAFSSITYSADSAISATPNSFEESHGRAGPEFRGNTLLGNSTNGVFLAIKTEFGAPLEKLEVSARFASTEVTYVIQESLVLAGGAGSYFTDDTGVIQARPAGRLQIDPGVVIKSKSSRIELERGNAQLLAEGSSDRRITFTSFNDVRFGAGGEFDTNGEAVDVTAPGDWGGIFLNAGTSASIDRAYIALGGGEVPLEGGLDDFNVIEVHQGELRLVNSRIENNASGRAETDRTSRGTNEAATIFVRGAQPIVVNNDFRNNAGALISINANSMSDVERGDVGRQTGDIRRFDQYDANRGPLLRNNTISNGLASVSDVGDGSDSGSIPADTFDIEINYVGTPDQALVDATEAAVARWEQIITAGVSEQVYPALKQNDQPHPKAGEPIDDIAIDVSLLDPEGNTLGQAWSSTAWMREANDTNPHLPFYSEIELVVTGGETLQGLTNTMVHEIGHSLGFNSFVLPALGFWDGNRDYIDGENALREYRKISPGANVIPLQDANPDEDVDGGAHWDEDEFNAEILTPISDGVNDVLSTLTIGLLEDIGYEVDYSKADSYTWGVAPNEVTLEPPASSGVSTGVIAGVVVRAEEIVVESIWDDTDIVHVVQEEIIVNNFHTATGLRLESASDASLVVKLDGDSAGFTASGERADIDDRIGGTVQVVGQPGFPVVLTSLADDSVGASIDVLGFPVTDTNGDGDVATPRAGDWRSLQFLPLANDRNVMVVNESESPYTDNVDQNNLIVSAELLGTLAPNFAENGNTWESAQEKTGDENRRLGFEVHGSIAYDTPSDVDIYSFDGTAGSEIWIDVDKTSSSLDTMVELLDASGRVLARSANSQNDSDSVSGVTVTAEPGGIAEVRGEEAGVIGTAAATTGVAAVVDGVDVTVTGAAARALGYQSQVIGIGARAAQPSNATDFDVVLDDATGIHVGAAATFAGAIPGGATVTAVDGNTITLDQALIGNINDNEWIEFGISGVLPFSSRRIIFDTPPEVGVWVGLPASGNVVQSIEGTNIAVLAQAVEVVPESNTVNVVQNFGVGGLAFDENGQPNNAESGIQGQGNQFYRLLYGQDASNGRTISFGEIAPASWDSLTIEADIRFSPVVGRTPGEGHSFVLQNTAALDLANGLEVEQIGGTTNGTNTAINQLGIHFDLNADAGGTPVPHMSFAWGNNQQDIEIDEWADSDWHDVEIEIVSHPQGGMISISLDGEFILEDEVLVGYQPGQQTRFIAAARSGPGSVDGTHDIDNVFATSLVPLFTTSTVGNLGLSGVAKPIQNLLVDDGTPVLNGATVNGGPTEVDANTTLIDEESGSTVALVQLDSDVTVNENQLLTFSLDGDPNVTTRYITVDVDATLGDSIANVIQNAKINGLPGIPDGTRVVQVDPVTNTLELSDPISNISPGDDASVGFFGGDNLRVVDASSLASGMPVSSPGSDNVLNGAEIFQLVGNEITILEGFDVADGEFLQFGFLQDPFTGDPVPINTNMFFVDEVDAVTLGSAVSTKEDPLNTLATVDSIDDVTGAVVLSANIDINDNDPLVDPEDLLIFDLNDLSATASRVVLDRATVADVGAIVAPVLVNMKDAGVLDQDVPANTRVVSFDANEDPLIQSSNILALSQPVTVNDNDVLGFGFNGNQVVLNSITGIDVGEEVTGPENLDGPSVPADTTVEATFPNNSPTTGLQLPADSIELSAVIDVADGVDLTFSRQEFAVLTAANVSGVAILPGTLTGVVYDGGQAIQTFTSNRDGTLVFTLVGEPASRVDTGSVDYESGEISLEFNTPPRAAIELRDVAFEYGNLSLETLGFEQNDGKWENGAFPLAKDAWRGGDYYTTNPRDAGMRVTLSGNQGTEQKYFVRVRSQPEIGADLAAHETNLTDPDLSRGKTGGSYELRIRTRQRDDKPGSVVIFADIRYPEIGIDVQGLPNNSPLVGTTGEDTSDNNVPGNAQQVGNLLRSDRNTISVAGAIANSADVDWYEFALTYEDIQSLTTHNDATKTFATVFDIDYGDQIRGDYGIAVFNENQELIYIGRDSNISDDRPGVGQGNDLDDLARGSVGVLDPFIGSVHLPTGSTEAQNYYVAVFSNGELPVALHNALRGERDANNNQVNNFDPNDPWQLTRLEPVNSVSRIVEDHIGDTGYSSTAGSDVNAKGIIDVGGEAEAGSATRLSAHVRPWTLADVTLYMSTTGSITTTNPFSPDGVRTMVDYNDNNAIGDLDMRTDGTLVQYVGLSGNGGTAGHLYATNWATGDRENYSLVAGPDNILDLPNPRLPTTDWWRHNTDRVDAVAIRRTNVGQYSASGQGAAQQAIYYSVRYQGESLLFSAADNGDATTNGDLGSRGQNTRGFMGTIQSAVGEPAIDGLTTGLQFQRELGTTLYGVSSGGQFYIVPRTVGTTRNSVVSATDVVDFSGLLDGENGFQGLATAPVNVEGGRFASFFFAVTENGRLVCIDPQGSVDAEGNQVATLVDNVFDTDGDGVADSHISAERVGNFGSITGLAFSPLDINLWHPTHRRAGDDGHGIASAPDNSRSGSGAGTSMYFGLESWTNNNQNANNAYWTYDIDGSGSISAGENLQYGQQPHFYDWRRELTQPANTTGDENGEIGENYNLPGGAHGSLVTGSFSLADLSYTDKPTAYVNYFLDTQQASSTGTADVMRDAARILGSADGGLTWELLATNNSTTSGYNGSNSAELPPLHRASSAISTAGYTKNGTFVQNQQVQQLFQHSSGDGENGQPEEWWRQVRIDLGMFAGESDVQLRFDFTTYGEFDTSDVSTTTPTTTGRVLLIDEPQTTVTLDSVEGLAVGMVVLPGSEIRLGTGIGQADIGQDGVVTIQEINRANGTIVLSSSLTTAVDQTLEFFVLQDEDDDTNIDSKNNIRGNARDIGDWGHVFDSSVNNEFEGFYIDDIIIGTAERGEMVTNASANADFAAVQSAPVTIVEYPKETLLGEYQLEIRRGTEYQQQVNQTTNYGVVRNTSATINRTFHTNDRFVTTDTGPVIELGRADISAFPSAELIPVGDGSVTQDPDDVNKIRLESPQDTTSYTHSVLLWNVDLSNQDSAFLGFTLDQGSDEFKNSLPEQFIWNGLNAGIAGNQVQGLPDGDGVAISTDGGTNWTRLADFSWSGHRVINIADAVDLTNADTLIGFFRRGLSRQIEPTYGVGPESNDGEFGQDGGIGLSNMVITTAPPTISTGGLGDSNNIHEFEQGQFIVASNIISNARDYGVSIDAGRDTVGDPDENYSGSTDAPDAGVARNFPTLINSQLVPGVIVSNNVIEASGQAGIIYSGETNTGTVPTSVRPFGRLMNNTIVGESQSGSGIEIENNAAATLMNNVFANLATGISVDDTSRTDASGEELTEIDTSAFYLVGQHIDGIDGEYSVELTDSPFMNIDTGNYYPSSSTQIVDSALNSLADRQPSVVERASIGISPSPMLAPAHDLYGQLRADDPGQATDAGLGFVPFKDRGAIERVDRAKPTATLLSPRDNGVFNGSQDQDSDVNEIRLEGIKARGVESFVIQLEDRGVGIDKTTVTTDAVVITKDGVPLVDGSDYLFQFNANTNQIILSSTVVYGLGDYEIQLQPSVSALTPRLLDLAGNPLFTNSVTDGNEVVSLIVELADVPSPPTQFTAVAGNDKTFLNWYPPNTAESSPITGYVIESRVYNDVTGWGSWSSNLLAANAKTDEPYEITVTNHELTEFRVYATNSLGQGVSSVQITATPSAPQDVTGVTGNESVTLSWKGSLNHGGLPINSYVIDQISLASAAVDVNVDAKGYLSADGERAYVFVDGDETDDFNELMIYNTSAPDAIQLEGQISSVDGIHGIRGARDVVVSQDGRIVYVVDQEGLKLWSIQNIATPIRLGEYLPEEKAIPTDVPESAVLSESEDFVFLSTGEVIDVRNPSLPELVEKTNLGESWQAAATVGDKLYTVNADGLQIFNVQDLALTAEDTDFQDRKYAADFSIDGSSTPSAAHNIAVVGDRVYVADDEAGFAVIDVSDLDETDLAAPVINPVTLSTLEFVDDVTSVPLSVDHVAVAGQRAYVGTEDNTLRIIDISDPTDVKELEKRMTPTGSDVQIDSSGSVVMTIDATIAGEMFVVDTSEGFERVATKTVDAEVSNPQDQTYNHEINALTKNKRVYFRVAAVNERGEGALSEYSEIQTPEGIPDAPSWKLNAGGDLGVSVNTTDGSIDLSWEDPDFDGGQPITNYLVQYKKVPDDTAWTQLGTGGSNTLTDYNLDELVKGSPYVFRVAAENAHSTLVPDDQYDWSEEVSITTPDVPQQAPNVSVVPSTVVEGRIRVAWSQVVSAPLPVTDYVIKYKALGDPSWIYQPLSVNILTTPYGYDIDGLDRSSGPYLVTVAAKNVLAKTYDEDAGTARAITNDDLIYFAQQSVNTFSAPDEVTALLGTIPEDAGNTVDLTWDWDAASLDNGGFSISDYEISYSQDSTNWVPFTDSVSTDKGARVTGLTNGVAYNFKVQAKNQYFTSTGSDAGPFTPVGQPEAPSLTASAGPGDGEVTLNWTINGNGGSALTGHRVEWKLSTETENDWQSESVGPADDSYTIPGLVKDKEYDVRVIAENGKGDSVPADGSVIPFGLPEAPTGLQFTPDQTDGSLQLSWTAPVDDGGERPVTYDVEYRPDGGTYIPFTELVTSDLIADIANLTPGSSHDFRVRARNDRGSSVGSLEGSFDAPDAPDALTGVTASTTGNNVGVVTLSWDTPTPAGLPVTGYKIEQLNGATWDDVTATPEDNSGTGKTTVEIPGLDRDNGDHFFRVAGLNVLTQNESDTVDPQLNYQSSDPIKPLDLPGTVRTLQATEGDGQVNLTWLQPLDNDGSQNAPGGEPITDYLVYYKQSAGNWNLLADAVTPSLSAVVPSLTNGTLYDFKVVAKTRLGEGPSDETDQSVNVLVVSATPRGAPAKPTNVSVTPLTGSLRVTWQAGSDNGAPISDHSIQVAESTNGPWISYADNDGVADDSSATISGVPTGVNLYVQVAAINEANDAEDDAKQYSDVVGPVVALGAPAAPTGLTAAANTNGTISLNWNAPTNIGGSAITDYVVEYRKITEQDWSVYEDGSDALSNTVITTLVRDDGPFEFRIKASNSIGTGPASDVSINVLPLAAPKAVQIQSITEGNEQLSVTWTAPSDNGGADVTDYIIEYKTTTQSIWTEVNDGTSTTTSVTISELTNGGNYQVRIRAVNSVGAGDEAISTTARPVTRPGIPGALNVEADSNQAKLTWTAPDNGGRTITDYVIEYRLASSSTWTTWNDGVSADTEETINVLTNGESYLFQVKAVTSFDEGDYATSEAAIIGPKAPAPIFAILQPHAGGLHVTYGRVVAPAGYEVLGHRIDYYDTETSQWITAKEVSALHNSATIEGLDLDQTYTVRVAAITSIGVGNFKLSNQVTL